MKNSVNHLPQHKRQELTRVTNVIRAADDDIEMIILFGSYARGNYKEKKDLKPGRWSGHISDYDILAVTGKQATAENTTLLHEISEQCAALNLSTTVRLIMHDIEYLNIQLAEGQYFFTDLQEEGCWLYNSEKFELSEKRQLTPAEQLRIANEHFDHWFGSANEFFDNFEYKFSKGEHKNAAFQLHQAAEAAYKTILLVLTNYSPDQHFLGILEKSVAKHHKAIVDVFPRETKAQHDRFEQLDQAYIGARYQPTWRISKDDLEQLEPCVRQLLETTESICQTHLMDLAQQA